MRRRCADIHAFVHALSLLHNRFLEGGEGWEESEFRSDERVWGVGEKKGEENDKKTKDSDLSS